MLRIACVPRIACVLRIACAIALSLTASMAAAGTSVIPGLIRTPLSIPITLSDGRGVVLEGLVIRPDRPERFPLIVLVHGTPRGAGPDFFAEIARSSPAELNAPAVAFAQRGYAAVSIMRRGFGRSGGLYAETLSGTCDDRDYLGAGRASGEDVAGAVAALRREPWVDPDRVLLLGWSTGGFASIAAAATNPSGVVGVLNFAGGRGSAGPDRTCSPDRLVENVGVFGRTARIPSLWLYAENDRLVAAALARRMFDAYVAGGAPAELQMLPAYGSDGHMVVTGSPDSWWRPVETFLAARQLPTSAIVELPPLSTLAPPTPIDDACTALFAQYVTARTDNKAFAVTPAGRCGFNLTGRSLDEAKEEAMRRCSGHSRDCKLYAAGQELVVGAN